MSHPDGAPILVATDFSADSEAALLWAVDLARTLEAPLHVLHVVHEPAEMPGYYRRLAPDSDADLDAMAKAVLDRHLEKMREKSPALDALDCESSIVAGLPETRILEVAQRIGARMVVIGARGETALGDALLGSRSDRVVRLSRIPVTVVRADSRSDAAGSG